MRRKHEKRFFKVGPLIGFSNAPGQSSRRARDVALCLKLPTVPYIDEGSGRAARMGVCFCDEYPFRMGLLICILAFDITYHISGLNKKKKKC